jgi:predicted neutral ceramidase superfamily lipid hydrolase
MNPVKRTVYLILCGVVVLTLAIIVLVLNRDTPSDLLAVIGIVGAVAIIIVSLPPNGKDK